MFLLGMIFPSNLENINNHSEIMTDSGGGGSNIVTDQLLHDALTTAAQQQQNKPHVDSDLPCFKDLIAVLIECFTIISLGYLSGRFKLISTEAKDIGVYLSTFALPLVIFLNIAQMEFNTINISFLFCMLISKLSIFIIVTILTLAISYPANFSYSGALSILCTQSNDFALGYPLIKSLYGKTRPEMLNYLNLMGPLQLLIINPLGIIMLEFGKSRSNRALKRAEAVRRRKACLNCSASDPTNKPPPPEPANVTKTISAAVAASTRATATTTAATAAAVVSGAKTAATIGIQNENQINNSLDTSRVRTRHNQRVNHSIPHSSNSHQRCHLQHQQLQTISSSLINLADYRHQNPASVNNNNSINNDQNNNATDKCLYSFESKNIVTIMDDSAKCSAEDKDQHDCVNNTIVPKRRDSALVMASEHDSGHSGATGRGIQRKNIKSLSLVVPATVVPIQACSDKPSDLIYNDQMINGQPSSQQLVFRSCTNSISGSTPSVRAVNAPLSTHEVLDVYTRPKVFNIASTSIWPSSSQDQQQVNEISRSPSAKGVTPKPAPGGETSQSDATDKCNCSNSDENAFQDQEPMIDLGFVRALLTNPLIIASVVALAVNLTNGPELPRFVTKVSNTIAASFAAPALFVVGLSMYGKFELIVKNPNDFLLSSVLATTKVMVLPCIMRTIVLMVLPHYVAADDVRFLTDFSYLYGLLPTAPGACIIAKQYGVLTNVVSICMLLSTLISGPLMLATSAVIYQAGTIKPDDVLSLIGQILRASSGVTLTLSLLTLYLLWTKSRQISYLIQNNLSRARATHLFTFLLALTQFVIGIGGIMWLFVDLCKLELPSVHIGDTTEPESSSFQWSHEDEDELMEREMSLSTPSTGSATFNQPLSASGPHGHHVSRDLMEQRYSPLCFIQFIISSGGILMARFIIMCIVVTNFAKRSNSRRFNALSSLLMRVYPVVSIGVIVIQIFEAQHLTCSPTQSSLPSWPISIYLRFVFNTILLCLTIVPFVATFRLDNKASWNKLQESPDCHDDRSGAAIKRRRFVTSSDSLTSETSSAITTSTSLDTSVQVGGTTNQLQHSARASSISRLLLDEVLASNNQQQNLAVTCLNDSLSKLVDRGYKKIELDNCDEESHDHLCQRGSNPAIATAYNDQMHVTYNHGSTATVGERRGRFARTNDPDRINRNETVYSGNICLDDNQKDPADASKIVPRTNDGDSPADCPQHQHYQYRKLNQGHPLHHSQSQNKTTVYDDVAQNNDTISLDQPYSEQRLCSSPSFDGWTEFDKYSILYVFMIFQVILNITSMIQQLCQDKPFGTFILIEATNVALNFGQGLVTFLVIGLQVVSLKDLISVGAWSRSIREQDHAIV